MEERMRFIGKWLEKEWSLAQLCREFGLSRKTGYKLLARWRESGPAGLADRSRAPLHPARAMGEAMEARLLAARRAHPTWGPRKLRAWLERKQPQLRWPATSSIGALLRREGLTVRRRRRSQTPPYRQPFLGIDRPNAVWCADFKGWFRTQEGKPCYPLTISDAYSRFLLRCQALTRSDRETVSPVFEAAFREFGLPEAIRTDNGPPFASQGVGGLSRLSAWWVKLGVRPERIAPASPQQNGRHERMHRTLGEATNPPQRNRASQQRAFDRFRAEYNQERPHEALAGATPASCYQPSSRRYRLRLPELDYPEEMALRRVRTNGEIRWQNALVYVGETLVGELVGLLSTDDGNWELYFGPILLGVLDAHRQKLLRPRAPRSRRAPRCPGPRGPSASRDSHHPQGVPALSDEKVLPMSPV